METGSSVTALFAPSKPSRLPSVALQMGQSAEEAATCREDAITVVRPELVAASLALQRGGETGTRWRAGLPLGFTAASSFGRVLNRRPATS